MGKKQDSKNVTFSKPFADADRSGYIWVAPAGTNLPTDAKTNLNEAFVGLGYISEDGLTEPAALELADGIVAAGGDTVAQGDPTFNKTWTGTCIEALNLDMLKTAYGTANVTGSGDTFSYEEKAITPEHHVIVIDELLSGNRRRRSVMADATFVITGDITHVHTDLMGFEFTITAYPSTALNGAAQKVYVAPVTAPGTGSDTGSGK